MPEPTTLAKAELQEITWDDQQQVQELDERVTVQFNPETLKVGFSNQASGGDQRGGAAIQFVGKGTTKLSFDLWFDVTVPRPDGSEETDVRRLTQKIAYFMTPKETDEEGKYIPPGVRFLWGTFLFEGVMDSLNETLEFFAEDGRPLRSSVSVSLSQQEIQFRFGDQGASGAGSVPGTTPQQEVRQGESVQDVAAREGRPEQWQQIALANGVENPRVIEAGSPLSTRNN